jgi:hypothetical protein
MKPLPLESKKSSIEIVIEEIIEEIKIDIIVPEIKIQEP